MEALYIWSVLYLLDICPTICTSWNIQFYSLKVTLKKNLIIFALQIKFSPLYLCLTVQLCSFVLTQARENFLCLPLLYRLYLPMLPHTTQLTSWRKERVLSSTPPLNCSTETLKRHGLYRERTFSTNAWYIYILIILLLVPWHLMK